MTTFKASKRSGLYLLMFWVVWSFFYSQVNLSIPICNSVSKRLMAFQWPLWKVLVFLV